MSKKLTKQQLIEELKAVRDTSESDPELAHGHADSLLLQYINDKEVYAIWKQIKMY